MGSAKMAYPKTLDENKMPLMAYGTPHLPLYHHHLRKNQSINILFIFWPAILGDRHNPSSNLTQTLGYQVSLADSTLLQAFGPGLLSEDNLLFSPGSEAMGNALLFPTKLLKNKRKL